MIAKIPFMLRLSKHEVPARLSFACRPDGTLSQAVFSLLETKFLVDLYTVPKNCSDKIVTSSWHHRERDITPRRHMNG